MFKRIFKVLSCLFYGHKIGALRLLTSIVPDDDDENFIVRKCDRCNKFIRL